MQGIGPKRTKVIWKYYDSIEDLKRDSVLSISHKTGIPINIVELIKKNI